MNYTLKLNSRILKRSVLVTGLALAFMPAASQAQQYWKTSGTNSAINTANWGASAAGPFTSGFAANTDIVFSATSLITGATVNVGNITVNDGVMVTFTAGGTLGTGGNVRTLNVGTGSILNLAGQQLSTAAGTGFIKSGSGILYSANPNPYGGGFTLNAGTVIVGGELALGSGGALTINGGTIAANATRDLSSRYAGGITIGGDFTLGEQPPAWGAPTLSRQQI